MITVKGYKPSKKCATYIKKVITRGTWKVNEKIPSTSQISEKLNISIMTVRNVLLQFEREGILRNMGSLGFYLISMSADKFKYVSKNSQYLAAFRTNLNAFTLLNTGGYRIQNWIIKHLRGTEQVVGLNEVTGVVVNTTTKELSSLQTSMLTLESILTINDPILFEKRKKIFDRQREILPLAKLVHRYKRDLGINE